MAMLELINSSLINDANLVAYYRFEQNGNDSKNSYTLTEVNTPPYGNTTPAFGYYVTPSTTGPKYLYTTNAGLDIESNMTIMAMVRTSTNAYMAIASVAAASDATGTRRSLFTFNDGTIAFSGNGANYKSSTVISDGNWHFVAFTLDGSKNVKVYSDGADLGGANIAGLTTMTYDRFYVGSDHNNEIFQGNIDELAVFNRVLTPTEIAAHWNGTDVPFVAPATPTNSTPADGSKLILINPALTASAFSTTDPSNPTHQASQWQLFTDAGLTAKVWDSGTDTTNKTSTTVNTTNGTFSGSLSGLTALAENTAYYWKVRYEDTNNMWSNYSTATSFTTLTPSTNYLKGRARNRAVFTGVSLG